MSAASSLRRCRRHTVQAAPRHRLGVGVAAALAAAAAAVPAQAAPRLRPMVSDRADPDPLTTLRGRFPARVPVPVRRPPAPAPRVGDAPGNGAAPTVSDVTPADAIADSIAPSGSGRGARTIGGFTILGEPPDLTLVDPTGARVAMTVIDHPTGLLMSADTPKGFFSANIEVEDPGRNDIARTVMSATFTPSAFGRAVNAVVTSVVEDEGVIGVTSRVSVNGQLVHTNVEMVNVPLAIDPKDVVMHADPVDTPSVALDHGPTPAQAEDFGELAPGADQADADAPGAAPSSEATQSGPSTPGGTQAIGDAPAPDAAAGPTGEGTTSGDDPGASEASASTGDQGTADASTSAGTSDTSSGASDGGSANGSGDGSAGAGDGSAGAGDGSAGAGDGSDGGW